MEADNMHAEMLRERIANMGGIEAYEQLTAEPLPGDEAFDWASVAPHDRDVAAAVLAALDASASNPWRRDEYRTIQRRLLAIAARQPEGTLRRRTSPPRIAAALAWIALAGNGDLGRRRGQIDGGSVWWEFDVSSCATLARSMAESLGMLEEQPWAPASQRWLIRLHDPSLLRGHVRARELATREATLRYIEEAEAQKAEEAVLQITPHGFALRAHDAELAMCVPVNGPNGRPAIGIALGSDVFEPDQAFFLSVDDGQRLLDSLRLALETHERGAS